jgi:hypothetical protein
MISAGADRASIVSDPHQQTVIVQGSAVSGAAGDISLEVEYASPGGDSCSETIQLTTIEVDLTLRSARANGKCRTGSHLKPLLVEGRSGLSLPGVRLGAKASSRTSNSRVRCIRTIQRSRACLGSDSEGAGDRASSSEAPSPRTTRTAPIRSDVRTIPSM